MKENRKKIWPYFLVFLTFFFNTSDLRSEETNDISGNVLTVKSEKKSSALIQPVLFFKKYISPIDGSRCPMFPSCSQYCLDAIEKHGILKGWVMSCDRLLRCGRDEVKLSPRIWVKGVKHCFDPVDNNDFWRLFK